MYRFLLRPRWIGFHLLVIVGVVVMVNLGFWQLNRHGERQDFNETVEARYDAPVATLDELLDEADGDVDAIEWRPVSVTGEFLDSGELLVVNRSQHGRAGDNVVTPFQLEDGRVVLVNRGFVPLGESAVADAPDGTTTIAGRIRPSEERRRGQLSDPADGVLTEVQRIDLPRLAGQVPGELVPAYIDLASPRPDAYPEPVMAPELTDGPHLSYMVQWFIFAACVVAGWVLAVRMSIRRRRATRIAAARADDTGAGTHTGSDEGTGSGARV